MPNRTFQLISTIINSYKEDFKIQYNVLLSGVNSLNQISLYEHKMEEASNCYHLINTFRQSHSTT